MINSNYALELGHATHISAAAGVLSRAQERVREAFFGSRQLKLAEIGGRAGAKKSETARKHSADKARSGRRPKLVKNRPSKKNTQFSPPPNERAG